MSDEDVLDRFIAVAHDIVWCTLATVAWPGGPDADDFAVLRLDAWRVRVATGEEMAVGTKPHVWSGAASAP
jgi:hypothetical protein